MATHEEIETGSNSEAETTVSVLDQVGLEPNEWVALRRQGYVSREGRGPDRAVFKLRFRCDGRQRVKYLGTNPVRAQRAAVELSRLQAARHVERLHKRVRREVSELLRDGKRRLEPMLEGTEFRFHGRAIRRHRKLRRK